jgi:signal peptidase I
MKKARREEDVMEIFLKQSSQEVLEGKKIETDIDSICDIDDKAFYPKPRSPSALRELASLGIKTGVLILLFITVFSFIFGFHKSGDLSMFPMVKPGDLVVYYRLDKDYKIGDLLVISHNSQTQVGRVIARAGDIVDIDENGLLINGVRQLEPEIYQETWQYEGGVRFPLTIENDQIFVLGDSRENATDSRIYGAIDGKDTLGTVITIIRRNSF